MAVAVPTSLARCIASAALLAVCVASHHTARAQHTQDALTTWLDRYDRGDSERVALELASAPDLASVRKELTARGASWANVPGPGEARRRRLVAATFALEIAQLYLWPEDIDPLVEWGCQLLSRDDPADSAQRRWYQASVAVFSRARDDGRLITRAGPGAAVGQRLRPPVRIDHVAHARLRFPDEQRFRLAEAMMAAVSADSESPRDVEWVPTDRLARNSDAAVRRARTSQAIEMFETLTSEPTLRAEAEVRAGYLWLTLHEPTKALAHFSSAQNADDVFVAYLATFLSGRTLDMLTKHEDAEAMYRTALSVLPHQQSAAEALAADLFLAGKPDEAYTLAQDTLSSPQGADDPWHQFGYGDLRMIPRLMSQLREALK